jgi:DNA-binding CsgD family transcriptional regulator
MIFDALETRTRHEVGRSVRLTPREMEVLEGIALGLPSAEIADRLCLSRRTVDFHLRKVYAKLSVNNRIRAIREAVRLGLLPFEPRHDVPPRAVVRHDAPQAYATMH